jgi:hypothetical protein
MTEELLAQAKLAENNIKDIKIVLDSIERIKILDPQKRNHKPHLRFSNILKKKDGKDIREATVLLFDGINMYGTEVPVDERLLNCLKEHYQERLSEAKAVLDAI